MFASFQGVEACMPPAHEQYSEQVEDSMQLNLITRLYFLGDNNDDEPRRNWLDF